MCYANIISWVDMGRVVLWQRLKDMTTTGYFHNRLCVCHTILLIFQADFPRLFPTMDEFMLWHFWAFSLEFVDVNLEG